MDKNKRNLIIILGSLLLIITGVVIYLFFFAPEKKTYIKEPISQTSLYSTEQDITLKESFDASEKPLYAISNKTAVENINEMISTLKLTVKESTKEDGGFYTWSGNDWNFFYDLTTNQLIFSISDGVDIGVVELNEYAFSGFVKTYFSQDWEYEIFETEKRSDGATVSYAKRKIGEDIIETKIQNKYTDYLGFKNGKIVYGKILLTQFDDLSLYAQLIDSGELNRLINVKGYPKEIFVDYSVLQSTVLQKVDYLGPSFEELTETVDNCVSNNVEIVYLYRSFDETYLTPVYKIDAQCTVEYEDESHSVPATVYVNAIDPEYVSMPE